MLLVVVHLLPALSPGRALLDAALKSPLYKAILVPQAKSTMVRTAEANGVAWRDSLEWIREQGPWSLDDVETVAVPEYYRRPFHAYEEGNLSWEAAWEGEIASRAVGARNFPAFGPEGETAFRGAFDEALSSLGASVPDGGVVCDLGCGTGLSSRRIAAAYPRAASVIGLDLSPYFIAVGRRLLEIAPDLNFSPGAAEAAEAAEGRRAGERPARWVNDVAPDRRVTLRCADGASTGLADESVDVVSLSFVVHELPPHATKAVVAEACRVLKPGGQLWLCEMDFDTPGFKKLRANPLLFSMIRSTEPYLDEYADFQNEMTRYIASLDFARVGLVAATGRHFALVATKRDRRALRWPWEEAEAGAAAMGVIDDRREETAKPDTHLKTWESRSGPEAN